MLRFPNTIAKRNACQKRSVHLPSILDRRRTSNPLDAQAQGAVNERESGQSPRPSVFRRAYGALALRIQQRRANKRSWAPGERVSYIKDCMCVMVMVGGLALYVVDMEKNLKAQALEKETERMREDILATLTPGSGERIPWPLLHRQITQMREGKQNIELLHSLYQHCKVYYPDDWLLLVEIGHILKENTNQSLISRAKIKDPTGFRHEILRHLIFLKHGKVPNILENLGDAGGSEVTGFSECLDPEQRIPDEAKPILSEMIAEVERSVRHRDGFFV